MEKSDGLAFARQRLEELEQSLADLRYRKQALDQRERELQERLNRWQLIVEELTEENKPAVNLANLDLSKGRLADACYPVLKALGHGLYGKDLVAELKKHGREIKAKNPIDSVNKMLQRDRRFCRPGDRGSFWELAEWKEPHFEEVEEPSTT